MESGAFWKSRIATIIEPRGSVFEYRAVDALDVAIVAEIVDRARRTGLIRHDLRQERLPSKSVIRGQTGREFPTIGCVQIDACVVDLLLIGHSLFECAHSSGHKVAHSEFRDAGVESESTAAGE